MSLPSWSLFLQIFFFNNCKWIQIDTLLPFCFSKIHFSKYADEWKVQVKVLNGMVSWSALQGLYDMQNSRSLLGVKKMGEVDMKPFHDACSKKFPNRDLPIIYTTMCSTWQHRVKDSSWHPFKIINGILQACLCTYTRHIIVLFSNWWKH